MNPINQYYIIFPCFSKVYNYNRKNTSSFIQNVNNFEIFADLDLLKYFANYLSKILN